jgi:hypothetical protein
MGYIAVDLDGTLAQYDGWVSVDHIGEPIPEMLNQVKNWLANGREVVIFTARVAEGPEAIEPIKQWLLKHVGQELPIVNTKDYKMIELWDDRAKQVIPNTGVALEDQYRELAKLTSQMDVFLSMLKRDQVMSGYSLPYWVQSEIDRLLERRVDDSPSHPYPHHMI